jgi:hypothetical protein
LLEFTVLYQGLERRETAGLEFWISRQNANGQSAKEEMPVDKMPNGQNGQG